MWSTTTRLPRWASGASHSRDTGRPVDDREVELVDLPGAERRRAARGRPRAVRAAIERARGADVEAVDEAAVARVVADRGALGPAVGDRRSRRCRARRRAAAATACRRAWRPRSARGARAARRAARPPPDRRPAGARRRETGARGSSITSPGADAIALLRALAGDADRAVVEQLGELAAAGVGEVARRAPCRRGRLRSAVTRTGSLARSYGLEEDRGRGGAGRRSRWPRPAARRARCSRRATTASPSPAWDAGARSAASPSRTTVARR